MPRTSLFVSTILGLAAGPLAAQGYTGTYAATNDAGGQTVVTLRQAADGQVTGTIDGNGNVFQIQGVLEDGSVVGALSGPMGGLWFEAELDEGQLYVTLVEPDANGRPNFETATTLVFARADALAQGGAMSANPLAGSAAYGQPRQPQQQSLGGQQMAVPGSGGLHDGTSLGREWAEFLAGKKATQMSSYSSGSAGGYSSRTDVHLCGNGQFALSGNSMVSADVGGVSGYNGGNSQGSGTWRIITEGQVAGIELRYGNGGVEQYRLDYQEGATYVNGERWYITPSEACGY